MRPQLGQTIVIHAPRSQSNGSIDHPAIVNRVLENDKPAVANVMVFPDHGTPYTLGSVPVFETFAEGTDYQSAHDPFAPFGYWMEKRP